MATRDSEGQSLIDAARDGNEEQVRELMQGGAKVDMTDKDGRTAFMLVFMHGPRDMDYIKRLQIQENIAMLLIRGGADVNMKDKMGKTALMHACVCGNNETVRTIIIHSENLDLEAQDNEGKTALMYAIAHKEEDIAMTIIEHSKDFQLDATDTDGQTALMKAIIRKIPKVALSLMKYGVDVNIMDKQQNTALAYATDGRYENIALALIENRKDLDLNSVDNQCQTALMKAIIHGMTEVGLALIERGADVNRKDTQENTALIYAIDGKHENTALAIIEQIKDLDLNLVDNLGQTALMKAIIRGTTKCALAMIKRGLDVNVEDKEGKTALMHAIENRRSEISFEIIGYDPLHLNISDSQNQTALMKAAIHGMTAVAVLLINSGADVNTKDKQGETALFHAIASKERDIALAIIQHSNNLDINYFDDHGRTALMKAAICGMSKVTLELIKKGANANMKDKQGKTALMHSIFLKRENTALAIIESSELHGVDLNITDNRGETALMKAASTRMLKVITELTKCGADVNIKEKSTEGKTALMFAIAWKEEDAALAIMEHSKDDINLNKFDNAGQTALIGATREGMTKLATTLIQAGADVNIKDNEGQTALTYAIAFKRENIAVAIVENRRELDLDEFVGKERQTLLMRATNNGMTNLVQALIKGGANVNLKDNEGKTALMFIGLIKKGEAPDVEELTLALISAGAAVNISDHKGNTALMYNVKYEASVKALIRQGKALVNARNNDGQTALFNATVENKAVARFLLENGANPLLTDDCNNDVLLYYIHHLLGKQVPSIGIPTKIQEVANILDEGDDYVSKAIINAIFCKFPYFFLKEDSDEPPWETLVIILKTAEEFSRNKDTKIKQALKRLVQKAALLSEKEPEIQKFKDCFFTLLETLADIVDNPNTGDRQGYDVFHYVTKLGLRGQLSKDDISKVCHLLERIGLTTNIGRYHKKETPLIFTLSCSFQLARSSKLHMEQLIEICTFLLQRGNAISNDVSQDGESIFHLIIKILEIGITKEWDQAESFMSNTLQLLELFSPPRVTHGVNIGDLQTNTPLHLLANISLPLKGKPFEIASKVSIWQEFSERIFNQLLSCGAFVHARNRKGQTALHLCKTWTTFTLLVKAGVNPNDVDSKGRSAVLSSIEKCLSHGAGGFYPDLLPSHGWGSFWKRLIDMGFRLWTQDKNGVSIVSILIRRNSYELADALIEIACDSRTMLSDDTLIELLDVICKDESTKTTWKTILIEKLLKSVRKPLDVSAPLRSCAMNVKHQYARERTESIHFENVKQLLQFRPDLSQSCLDIAEGCPPLQALLSSPISINDIPLVIPWTSFSRKHKNMLARVARRQNCEVQGAYWYHSEYIGTGAFSEVFVGIHEKDGMEVAIKKVNRSRNEDLREIRAFASVPICDHVVRYLTFLQTTDFSFIVMELMEGNLDEYFGSPSFDKTQSQTLCRNITHGLSYLHEQNIIHRDLKPGNILYKTYPRLCLKIADFGLSRRLQAGDNFTVMATGVGTRGWIAPEVIKSGTQEYSKSSDVFSLGLILHYILSNQRHPFSPADCNGLSYLAINNAVESNVLGNKVEGWDKSLNPEAFHLIAELMLDPDKNQRPAAANLLEHPMFWSKNKKLQFLSAVGNQGEFECPRAKRTLPLTMVEQDLEKEFASIVKFGQWDDQRYTQTSVILHEMKRPIVRLDGTIQHVRKNYDYGTVVELVRLIRNAIAHVSEAIRPSAIRTMILDDAVFLDEFPNLVLEVYKAVTNHGWCASREEIKRVLANDDSFRLMEHRCTSESTC